MRTTVVQVKSFEEFKLYVTQNSNRRNIRLFRGQENATWNLNSQLYRLVKDHNKVEQLYDIEKSLFNSFKQKIKGININFVKRSEWDLLSLAQHYKLPTRLIDWSSNALTALWFAFKDPKKDLEFRSVWGLSVAEKHKVNRQKDDLFKGRFVKVFKPNNFDARIKAQKAWFAIHKIKLTRSFSGDGLPKFDNYNIMNKNKDFDYYLVQIQIPNDLRENILNHLEKIGIEKESMRLNLRNEFSKKMEQICSNLKNEFFK